MSDAPKDLGETDLHETKSDNLPEHLKKWQFSSEYQPERTSQVPIIVEDGPLPATNWDGDPADLGYRGVFDQKLTPLAFGVVLEKIIAQAQGGSYRQQELLMRMANLYEPHKGDKDAQKASSKVLALIAEIGHDPSV